MSRSDLYSTMSGKKSRMLFWCGIIFLSVFVTSFSMGCSGCGSRTYGDEDGSGDDWMDPSHDDAADLPGESADESLDAPDDDDVEEDGEPQPYVPQCGNGIIDEGEACDDRNRLNGDGCDWLCLLGDGEPPPDPDPATPPYEREGDPVPFEDISSTAGVAEERLPFVWTGSQYATAFYEDPSDDTRQIRFRRFDGTGVRIDSDWIYPVPFLSSGHDLVWNGSGFGLFYVDRETGIYFMRLNEDGKPLGEPVLIEPDPRARGVAADLADGGFVVAWTAMVGDDGVCSAAASAPDSVRVRLVGLDGAMEGFPGPVTVEGNATGWPDVAAGEGGFGVTLGINPTDEFHECAYRFVRLSSDLEEIVPSGILADGFFGDVAWADGHYLAAWMRIPEGDESLHNVCVARFSAPGELEGPPVCNRLPEAIYEGGVVRLAAGDGGLAIVFAANADQWLYFLRSDMMGRALEPPFEVMPSSDPTGRHFGPCNVTRADDIFGVLYTLDGGIWLQLFSAVE